MTPKPFVLALDCGTTGNRAIVFDASQRIVASAYREFRQYYPKPGWVEHDAEEIWNSVRTVLTATLKKVPVSKIGAVGVTNQRETIVVWNPVTGKPFGRAIVWQCRRTAAMCEALKKRGLEPDIHRKTGLFLDPYFSATKIAWLMKHDRRIASGLQAGRLICGTIDAWIVWKLSGGRSFSTDPTNASRTMLYDIRKGKWDPGLLKLFGVPLKALPRILPSLGARGTVDARIAGGSIPIAGVVGDQQSASFAQGCFRKGTVKNTYGTGLFVVAETGSKPRFSKKLVTTVAVTTGKKLEYALEGSIFIGGAAVQWLRDGLKLIGSAAETKALAESLGSNEGVYFVPALAGLGCPHWDSSARGAIFGLTRQTARAHVVRAALEAMAYQTRDVIELVVNEMKIPVRKLSVDGGAVKNDWLMQFQADTLGCEVDRPVIIETTALGAAALAGICSGLWRSKEDFIKRRKLDRIFKPKLARGLREAQYARWLKAVERAKGWE